MPSRHKLFVNIMSRKKFRRTPRFESTGDRSFQEYILNTPAPPTSRTELLRLIRGGEDTYLELKVKLSNPERIAQEIIALANTDGGVMVFGVSDQLRIEGLTDPESVQAELVKICREEDTILPLFRCLIAYLLTMAGASSCLKLIQNENHIERKTEDFTFVSDLKNANQRVKNFQNCSKRSSH